MGTYDCTPGPLYFAGPYSPIAGSALFTSNWLPPLGQYLDAVNRWPIIAMHMKHR